MADFEDANSPTWHNMIEGQINLRDAIRRTIAFTSPDGKEYRLKDETAVLMVRPRGWHLPEKHVLVDGQPVPGALFDFGLYFFHNARELLERGTRAVLLPAQDGEPPGGAAVERRLQPGAGRAGHSARHHPRHRADRDHPGRVRDGRNPVRAARPLGRAELRALGLHLQLHQEVPQRARLRAGRSRAGHDDHALHALLLAAGNQDVPPAQRPRHGRHGRADPDQERSRRQTSGALEKVRADKQREANDGHDGTWVAHPGLVRVALEEFDRECPRPTRSTASART